MDVRPEKPGDVVLSLVNEAGEEAGYGFFKVGRFGTVYNLSNGEFTGDNIVMCALTYLALSECLLLLLSYRRAKGASFYGYSTIYAAGFSHMVLRIRVDSVEGDKVTVNLPIAIVKMGIKLGMTMPQINGNKALEGIDFEEVIKLVDAGLVGELVTVESAEGDHVRICVE